jgi:subtilisin
VKRKKEKMKKIVAILMAMMLVISVTVVLAGGVATTKEKQSEKVPVIIMFKDKTDKDLIKQHGGELKCVYQIKPAVAVSLPQKAIDALEKNPKIAFIVPDLEIFTMADETLEWGVDRIDADIVHEYNKGTGVKVAIMDTGIDYNHPDLAANYKGGYDCGGRFVWQGRNDDDPMDKQGHGTHCAGIVAAVKGNDIGVIGVAPEAYLYAVKVFDDRGNGRYSDVIEGLEWCIDNDIQVISMSFGSAYSAGDPGIEPWINAAYDAGILLVGAAGNEGSGVDTVIYPARYDAVIAVAATDGNDDRASWSSTGPDVELAAPGVSIYSTYRDDTYATLSGTSMACPHVSGTAALVIAAGEGDVRQRLKDTADDLGAPGKDNLYGHGLVDADEAAPPTGPPNVPPLADANGPYTGDEGSSIEFDGSGSSDPDGTIESYEWAFGDGTTGSGSNPTHAYANNGEYTVTLTVTDDDGGIGTDTTTATISNVVPTADAGGPYEGYAGQAVTFAGSATDPGTADVLTYEWDFDHGETFATDERGVDLANPSYTYAAEGIYTVALRVKDDDGGVSTISTATVTITAPDKEAPVITDAIGDTTGTTGEPVTVSATITDNVGVVSATVHYTPIGTTEETTVAMTKEATSDVWSADVPVDSDNVGTITYYITAQDAAPKTARDPAEGTYSITVTDNDAPIAEAGPDQSVLVNEMVTFDGSGSSDNIGITSYSWDFDASNGIGGDANGVTATHTYTTAGDYTVTLTVDDVVGNGPVSDAVTVTVSETPVEVIEFEDSYEGGLDKYWVQDSQNDWSRSGQRAKEGLYSAEVDGRAKDATLTLATPIDLNGKTRATLTFSWFIEKYWGSGEYIALDIFDGSWHEFKCLRGNVDSENVWHDETIDLSAYMVSNFKIRFRAQVSSSREDGNVDNVTIITSVK